MARPATVLGHLEQQGVAVAVVRGAGAPPTAHRRVALSADRRGGGGEADQRLGRSTVAMSRTTSEARAFNSRIPISSIFLCFGFM